MNNWMDDLRKWDYSLEPVWYWLRDIAGFHIQNNGIWGYVAIGVTIITIGLSIKELRHTVSLILSSCVRAVGGMFTITSGLLLSLGVTALWKTAWSSIFGLLRSKPVDKDM